MGHTDNNPPRPLVTAKVLDKTMAEKLLKRAFVTVDKEEGGVDKTIAQDPSIDDITAFIEKSDVLPLTSSLSSHPSAEDLNAFFSSPNLFISRKKPCMAAPPCYEVDLTILRAVAHRINPAAGKPRTAEG